MPEDATLNSTYDYYNPFMAVAINTPEGERFPLWSSQQLSDGSTDFPPSMAWVTQVEVNMQLGEIPVITVTLSPPYRDAQAFLNSPLIEWGGSTLDVQFGYVYAGGAVLSPPMTGVMLKPEVSIGADIEITLKAQGTGGFSAARSKSGRTFNNMTRFDIITEVANGPRTAIGAISQGISNVLDEAARLLLPESTTVIDTVARTRNLTIDASAVEQNSALRGLVAPGNIIIGALSAGLVSVEGSFAYDELFVNEVTESQGNLSDWAFMQKLVKDARCGMTLNGSTLVIFSLDAWMAAPPQRTFRLFDYPLGSMSPQAGVFPILSFSSDTLATYMPGSTRNIKVVGVDSETREIRNVAVNDEEVKPSRSGPGPSSLPPNDNDPPVNELGDGGGFHPGSPTDDRVMASARAAFLEDTTKMGINVEIGSLADPTLFPGATVGLAGISARHDSPKYGVTEITWTFNVGGAEMTFSAISNASLLTDRPYPVELDAQGLINVFTTDDTPGGDDADTGAPVQGGDSSSGGGREQQVSAWE